MFTIKSPVLLIGLVILVGFTTPGLCFGAGNIASISKVEGQNCTFPLLAICLFFLLIYLLLRAPW